MRACDASDPLSPAILLLEPDPLVREALVATFRLHDRSYRPEGAPDLEAALAAIDRRPPQLVVAEIALPGGPGPAVVVDRLRGAAPGVPILGLTRAPREVFRARLGLDGLLEHPPDVDRLLRRVDDLLGHAAGSVLRGVSLASLLQILDADRKSCAVVVDSAAGRGRIWLAGGRVADADFAGERGKPALFRLLSAGEAVLRLHPETPPRRTIDGTLPALLLEHSVLADHIAR